ncbi:MAG: hypothetical protein APR53_01025 [Methanoculleus sp. SDB]|nr:MAG: hypothetical protein APR53_01025 [Methanoculleus sp. SDB]
MGVVFFSGAILLAGGLVQLLLGTSDGPVSMMISAGFVMVLLAAFRLLQPETHYLQDERTKKIGAYGLSYSWFLTFLVLFAIFWINYLHIFALDVETVTVGLILLMGISAKLFQWHLFRKGDVA